MKIDKTYKLEKCVSTDATRQVLHHIRIERDGDKARAIVTDGQCLVSVPVTMDEEDTDGLLSVESLKAARKEKPKDSPAYITVNGSEKTLDGTERRRPEGTYPNWKGIIPRGQEIEAVTTISLDAKLLLAMQEAMGVDYVKLTFNGDLSPITVNGGDNGQPFGVLMPFRIN